MPRSSYYTYSLHIELGVIMFMYERSRTLPRELQINTKHSSQLLESSTEGVLLKKLVLRLFAATKGGQNSRLANFGEALTNESTTSTLFPRLKKSWEKNESYLQFF